MSLFDKIKSAVMGNPVTREYEIVRHVASAGPGLLWKVHSGFKKSSRQEVSIFVLEKKAPEFEKMPKKQREAIYEMLKKVWYMNNVVCTYSMCVTVYVTMAVSTSMFCTC